MFWGQESYAELSAYLDDGKPVPTLNRAALRVILALLDYLGGINTPKRIRYTDIPSSIQQEIRTYIDMALVLRFNAPLPDPLDKISIGDIHEICKPGWENFEKLLL